MNGDYIQWLERLHTRVVAQRSVFYPLSSDEREGSPSSKSTSEEDVQATTDLSIPPLIKTAPKEWSSDDRLLESWKIRARPSCFPASVDHGYWNVVRDVYRKLSKVVQYINEECAAAASASHLSSGGSVSMIEQQLPKAVDYLVGYILHDIVPFYLSWHATEIGRSNVISSHHQDIEELGSICASIMETLVYIREKVLGEADRRHEATYLETLIVNKLATNSEAGQLLWRYTKVSCAEDIVQHHQQITDALTILRWLVDRDPGESFVRCLDHYVKTDPPLIDNIIKLLETIREGLNGISQYGSNDMRTIPRLLGVQGELEQFLEISARCSSRVQNIYIMRGVIELLLDSSATRTPGSKRQALKTLAAICCEIEGAVYIRANTKFLECLISDFSEPCFSWLSLIKIYFQVEKTCTEEEQLRQRVKKIQELPRSLLNRVISSLLGFAETLDGEEAVECHPVIADIVTAIWTVCNSSGHILEEQAVPKQRTDRRFNEPSLTGDLTFPTSRKGQDSFLSSLMSSNAAEPLSALERILHLGFKNAIFSEAVLLANIMTSDNELGVESLQLNFARPSSAFAKAERVLLECEAENGAQIKTALRLLASIVTSGLPCASEIRATLCQASVCTSNTTWLHCLVCCTLRCAEEQAWHLVNCCTQVLLLWSSSLRQLSVLEEAGSQRKVSMSLWENINFEKVIMLDEADQIVKITTLLVESGNMSIEWALFLITLLGRSIQIVDASEIYRIDEVFKIFSQSEIDLLAATVIKIEQVLGQDTIRQCFTKITDLHKSAIPFASHGERVISSAALLQFNLLDSYLKKLATFPTHSKSPTFCVSLPTSDLRGSLLTSLTSTFTPHLYVNGLIYFRLSGLNKIIHAFASRTKQTVLPISSMSSDVVAVTDMIQQLTNKFDALASTITNVESKNQSEKHLVQIIGVLSTKLDEAHARIQDLEQEVYSLKDALENRAIAILDEPALHQEPALLSPSLGCSDYKKHKPVAAQSFMPVTTSEPEPPRKPKTQQEPSLKPEPKPPFESEPEPPLDSQPTLELKTEADPMPEPGFAPEPARELTKLELESETRFAPDPKPKLELEFDAPQLADNSVEVTQPVDGSFGVPQLAGTPFGAPAENSFPAPQPADDLFGVPQSADAPFGAPVKNSFSAPQPADDLFGVPQPADDSLGVPQPADDSFGVPQPADNPIEGSAENWFQATQPADDLFGVPQPADTPFGAPAENSFSAPQPAVDSFEIPQPAVNWLGVPQPAVDSFGVPQPVDNPFGAAAENSFSAPQPADDSFEVPQCPDIPFGAAAENSFSAPQPADTSFEAPSLPENSFIAPQLASDSFGVPQPADHLFGALAQNSFLAPQPADDSFGVPQPADHLFGALGENSFLAAEPADDSFGVPQLADNPFGALAQNSFLAPQPADNSFGVPQPAGHLFEALAENSFLAPQPADDSFLAPQPADDSFGVPQLPENSFLAPPLVEDLFAAPGPSLSNATAKEPETNFASLDVIPKSDRPHFAVYPEPDESFPLAAHCPTETHATVEVGALPTDCYAAPDSMVDIPFLRSDEEVAGETNTLAMGFPESSELPYPVNGRLSSWVDLNEKVESVDSGEKGTVSDQEREVLKEETPESVMFPDFDCFDLPPPPLLDSLLLPPL